MSGSSDVRNLMFRLQDQARVQTLRELEAVKNMRKDGGNEEDWTVEGFGNKTTPAPDQKPSVRFTDVTSTAEKVSSSEGRSEDFKPSGPAQATNGQSGKERAR